MAKRIVLSVPLSRPDYDRLTGLAKRHGLTRAGLVRLAVRSLMAGLVSEEEHGAWLTGALLASREYIGNSTGVGDGGAAL